MRFVNIYSVEDGLEYYSNKFDRAPLQMAWSADSAMIAIAFNEMVNLYALNDSEPMASIPISGVSAIDWSSDGTKMATGGTDGVVRVWGVPSSEAVGSLEREPPVPLVLTIQPNGDDMPFVVLNNEITYYQRTTISGPCNAFIEGQVTDMEGNPLSLSDYVVIIKMLSDMAPVNPSVIFPSETDYGAMLPGWDVYYEIWLSADIGSEPISSYIYVEMNGCENNVAIVNFVQIKPIDQ
jgi:hypothetical protein